MRWIAIVLVAACGSSPKPASNQASNPSSSGPIVAAKLLGIDDFAAAGATLTKVSDTETLVCQSNGDDCVCMKTLDCGTDCITLAKNLAVFREALASTGERTVSCELADTGKFCDLSYFRFEGDIYRWETRYFGTDGKLVGQTNATDYPEYCGGQARRQFLGRVPDCAMQPRDVELICAEPEFRGRVGKLPNPKDLLLP